MFAGGVGRGDIAPRAVGLAFIILASLIILAGWVLSILIIIAGKRLKARKNYNYCIVVAFIECLFVPLGTVLGVFTIINLNKESVRSLFD